MEMTCWRCGGQQVHALELKKEAAKKELKEAELKTLASEIENTEDTHKQVRCVPLLTPALNPLHTSADTYPMFLLALSSNELRFTHPS